MKGNIRLFHPLYVWKNFIFFVIKSFMQDECFYIASALAFTTLLAIVPLMAVGFAELTTFPVFQGLNELVQNFIFDNFVPSTAKIVEVYLKQFASQATNLSICGLIFLIISALLVMVTIEKNMNKIWQVTVSRHGFSAFFLYLAILSLGPIILGFSLVVSSYIFSLSLLANHYVPSLMVYWIPFFLSLTGFWFLYAIVPNYPVKIRHAFFGGLFAALLFEMTKHGFAYYLRLFNTYELLYGAFSSVPIFCIWIYLVWIITLVGAEISHAFAVPKQWRGNQPI